MSASTLSTEVRVPLLLIFSVLLAGAAHGQTPTTTIENGNTDTRLQLNYDGGLYVPGSYGPTSPADSIPTEGPGTRLMWYPAEAAFRAGRVFDNSSALSGVDGRQFWNASNVGSHSVAFGQNTKASGTAAVAMGTQTTATNTNALAIGVGTAASGNHAVALGSNTTAATNRSLTIGTYNNKNNGNDDNDSSTGPLFVVGNGTLSTPSDALVLDQSGNLEVSGGFVLPDGTTLDEASDLKGVSENQDGVREIADSDGFAVTGTFSNIATSPPSIGGSFMQYHPETAAFRGGQPGAASDAGNYSFTFGDATLASTKGATAIGNSAQALGVAGDGDSEPGPTAIGHQTYAEGKGAVALGNDTDATSDGATAMGSLTKAIGTDAAAFGTTTRAATPSSFTVGKYNDTNTSADNTLFVVGNGSGTNSRNDALVLDGGGNLTISGGLTQNSDRRLKTDIEPLSGGILQKIGALRPVRYRFKDPATHPSGEQIGLIAQKVQKQFPALVSEGSGGTLSLSYSKMTAVLLKGVQEQQAELDEKTETIADLNAEIEALNDQHDELTRRLATLEAQTEKGSILAGGSGSGILALLLALGIGLGGGLLWRGRIAIREAEAL
ncbi:tail fiber domain-containing protein [Salinibacter grassmerensis]|uniref:tail fiber domain-containing protein n=1 Tax=Salinibacter grassmerensis TaxID=3040353 RepID=UPI0021E94BF4|nr:tail fiber domain-containing protein [Salinibacter grassmerensis]